MRFFFSLFFFLSCNVESSKVPKVSCRFIILKFHRIQCDLHGGRGKIEVKYQFRKVYIVSETGLHRRYNGGWNYFIIYQGNSPTFYHSKTGLHEVIWRQELFLNWREIHLQYMFITVMQSYRRSNVSTGIIPYLKGKFFYIVYYWTIGEKFKEIHWRQ